MTAAQLGQSDKHQAVDQKVIGQTPARPTLRFLN